MMPEFIIIIGVIISLIFFELTDISPGGIIVPSVLVLYISRPERLLFTLFISLITFGFVKLLSRFVLIYGKRRFAILIIVSIAFNFIFGLLLNAISSGLITVSAVGYIIPGIIASTLYKQGIKRTMPALIIVTGFIYMILIILQAVGL